MLKPDQVILTIRGNINTNYEGFNALTTFYNQARKYTNRTIHVDFYHLKWLDANLCALLVSILYKLKKTNGLQFATDLKFLEEKFDVLARNGFINTGETIIDDRKSTVSLRNFLPNEKDEFMNYLEKNLMSHRGMPNLSGELEYEITESLGEIFTNTVIHAETNEPFFVCGQYYPILGYLVFTMVDLGIGFLPPIRKITNGRIANSADSILWALKKGTTSKIDEPGGLGLYNLHKLIVSKNYGKMHIISGDAYWGTDMGNSPYNLRHTYIGATINLFFRHA